jgi:hypothetical protein
MFREQEHPQERTGVAMTLTADRAYKREEKKRMKSRLPSRDISQQVREND